MQKLALAIVAVVLLWGGHWAWQAQMARAGIMGWFEERRADGWDARYDELELRGFPNRLDVTLSGLVVTNPEGSVHFEAPFLQSFQLVYKPGHRIFAFPPEMVWGETRITSDGLRASLVQQGDLLDRFGLEAAVLNLDAPERAVALAGVTAGFERFGTDATTYRLAVGADALAGGGSADGLRLQAEMRFDQVWQLAQLPDARPQPQSIDLRLFEYQDGPLLLKMGGTLDVDPVGRGTGKLTLRAENWQGLLTQAREAGQIGPGLADLLEDGLSLYARLTGNGRDLDLPLDLQRGQVTLGPISLGEAPLFRLP